VEVESTGQRGPITTESDRNGMTLNILRRKYLNKMLSYRRETALQGAL